LKSILTEHQLSITIKRLAHQVLENHVNLENTVLIGLQPRGIFLSDKIIQEIKNEIPSEKINYGKLDITFYRDDIRKELHHANQTDIPFTIEGKVVVLIDDVLYTGRTIRAALDAIMSLGRAKSIALAVLIDRGHRELPIRPDYIGKNIPTSSDENIRVELKENDGLDRVSIIKEN